MFFMQILDDYEARRQGLLDQKNRALAVLERCGRRGLHPKILEAQKRFNEDRELKEAMNKAFSS